ncbi:MAG: apolipoprotein N-acyltransferase, partial [Verrucomicrobiota bacterium]|nr:apolipoprotein N-acyltransferase [Verrucomicrobiota bacterium]
IWVWLCGRLQSSKFTGKNAGDSENFSTLSWPERTIYALSCAALWVALEMIRARLFSGFPWNFLGVSQVELLPLIQVASITGVHGVSFLIVWFSVSLFAGMTILIQKPSAYRVWIGEIIVPLGMLIAIGIWGYERILAAPPLRRNSLKVALIQPSIPQTLIFDAQENPKRFSQLLELSKEALLEKPDLLIWPEAAMPPFDTENVRAITELCVAHRIWMVIGADDAQISSESSGKNKYNYFNAAFLFDPEGKPVATYHKQRLVIFGEYVPLDWLPFMKYLTPIGDSFTAGKKPVPFRLSEPDANFSTLICFEDVFPHFTSDYVASDTDFLLNLTNDGWFGQSAAQWQQAFAAVFRCVENGIPLVRCTNNGLTCWIDEWGRMRTIFRGKNGNIYERGFMIAQIPLLNPGEKRISTFYHQHGEWFGWSCVVTTLIICGRIFLVRKAK